MLHSPGPWEVGTPVDSDGSLVYVNVFSKRRKVSGIGVYGVKRDGTIAGREYKDKLGTMRHAKSVTEEECMANARLIAAAPDMLDALEKIKVEASILISEYNDEDTFEFRSLKRIIDLATCKIARATEIESH